MTTESPTNSLRLSTEALLAQLVDYAGLFPPAKLDMAPTVANYATYAAGDDASAFAPPSEEELERVRGVLSEWDDVETYLPKVNAPGSRIGSYREASPSGSTLVAFLNAPPPPLLEALRAFRAAVDAALPAGRYAWLDEASLHCTVRAIV